MTLGCGAAVAPLCRAPRRRGRVPLALSESAVRSGTRAAQPAGVQSPRSPKNRRALTRRPDAGATDRTVRARVVVVGCRVSAVISPYRRRVVRVTCRLSFRRGDTDRTRRLGERCRETVRVAVHSRTPSVQPVKRAIRHTRTPDPGAHLSDDSMHTQPAELGTERESVMEDWRISTALGTAL